MKRKLTEILPRAEMERILAGIAGVRICAIGDVCLDLYWFADMKRSLLSRETPHYPLPVVRETASPGGGGNVMANIAALGAELYPISVLGNDWRGTLLRGELAARGIAGEGLLPSGTRCTPAYCKPMRMGISDVVYEDPRIDFENREPMGAEDERAVCAALREAAGRCGVIAVADQLEYGVVAPAVRGVLAELAANGKTVIADSRSRLAELTGTGILIKPNEVEASRLLGTDVLRDPEAAAGLLAEKCGRALMTLGGGGAVYAEAGREPVWVPAVAVRPPVDFVGCGDTFLSAFACAYAVCGDGGRAAAFANIAASVTLKKIGTTGTASPDEIRARYTELEEV